MLVYIFASRSDSTVIPAALNRHNCSILYFLCKQIEISYSVGSYSSAEYTHSSAGACVCVSTYLCVRRFRWHSRGLIINGILFIYNITFTTEMIWPFPLYGGEVTDTIAFIVLVHACVIHTSICVSCECI